MRSANDDQPLEASELIVQSATWGVGNRTVDVTDIVRRKARANKLSVQATNEELGSDPAHGAHKQLTIEYSYGGQRHSRTVGERETLSIPRPGMR
jgi:hypothetical protein